MTVKTLKLALCAAICFASTQLFAQTTTTSGQSVGPDYTTITTAVPFMRISPDARSGAMGDVGIAIDPDANSQYWNVSKLAMAEKDAGVSITYTPWLKDLVPDIFLAYVAGYLKFGDAENKNQAISFSMRYFNLGSISYTTIDATPAGTGNPREMAFDLGYSRKLSESFSLGLTGKYIHSNIINGAVSGYNYKPGNSFAVDFGAFYKKMLKSNDETGKGSSISAGIAITNLGTKVSYSSTRKDFIPTNLGIGVAYNYSIDEYNKLTVALDANKLLVPSPQWKDSNGNFSFPPQTDTSVISGIFGSFSDATGGSAEEFREVMWSLGAEYAYQNQFFARAGYFYESKQKGDRRFLSLGVGVKYNVFGLNFAYLVPSGSGVSRNPLSNTLRFSLMFDFNDFASIAKGGSKGSDK
jgi:hypothetical protein